MSSAAADEAQKRKLESGEFQIPPSHILSDGRFVHLALPTASERAEFFARSVARHALISATERNNTVEEDDSDDGGSSGVDDDDAPDSKKKSKKSDELRIHPLAIASARLNAHGISELSKAINLAGLVGKDEYFGLSNIVNTSLGEEDNLPVSAAISKKAVEDRESDGKDSAAASDRAVVKPAAVLASEAAAKEAAMDEARRRAYFILKRKQSQFAKASRVLARHSRRLTVAVACQRVIDRRFLTLRKKWRLVAPEHGTRAIGPVRPTEVVAVDVEIYDRDRTGGGNAAATEASGKSGGTAIGRIARMVPRYATIQLSDDFDGKAELRDLKEESERIAKRSKSSDLEDCVETKSMSESHEGSTEECRRKTRAKPFAVADPTLGKIDPDFDPDKVPMLTLLLKIEKSSTGYSQSVSLSSSSSTKVDGSASPDEMVIEALQHSLFCASLFESIRREITSTGGKSAAISKSNQPVVWLSSEMEEAFLPPPSLMAGREEGVRSLCVVHCHEGEVKVQLDSEYALTIQLAEAGVASSGGSHEDLLEAGTNETSIAHRKSVSSLTITDSGSQSPEQLHALSRALLLHAQFVYHDRCRKSRSKTLFKENPSSQPVGGFARGKKESLEPSGHILQSCVGLGARILFETKVRKSLQRISKWWKGMNGGGDDVKKRLQVEWLPLSFFDIHSQFALAVGDMFSMDVSIHGDRMCVTSFGIQSGEYRTVHFGSTSEFEFFLTFEISRHVLLPENERMSFLATTDIDVSSIMIE